MAAGPAIEMWSKQTQSAEVAAGRVYSLRATRAFTVTLAATDALEIAYTSLGLPLVNELYPGAVGVFCTRLSPQRVSPILAIVTAEYQGETGPMGLGSSPIDTEVRVTWGTATTDEPIDEDWNGNPIVTANGEPINGLTEKLSDDVVTIERKFLTINRYALRAYRRATNSDEFLEWPPGTARIVDDSSRAVFVNGVVAYWDVTATIQFREPFRTTADKAWYKRVRHEGLLVRPNPGESPVIAVDASKTPVTRPVLLKEDGTRETDPNNAHWLEFQTLGSLPFNALGLIS